MKGHKWELFCLYLSYIGWYCLSCLTMGILFLWVIPKIEVSVYAFYLNISGKLNENQDDGDFVNNEDSFILSKDIIEDDDVIEEIDENDYIIDDYE